MSLYGGHIMKREPEFINLLSCQFRDWASTCIGQKKEKIILTQLERLEKLAYKNRM